MLKKYTIDAELAGHAHKLDIKLQRLCVFYLMGAYLASFTT